MTEMLDRNDNIVHFGELVTLIGRHDILMQEYWCIFDMVKYSEKSKFILRNCVTNEFEIVDQEYIERTY